MPGDGGPENLSTTEHDQSFTQRDDSGPLRRTRRYEFRPQQNFTESFDGPGGDRNEFRGVGTDTPGDVGSSGTGFFASLTSRKAPVEPSMPNAKSESDPLEEGQSESGAPGADNQAFYDMQAR